MDTREKEAACQWFYDDAGYYSYVLLMASDELFEETKELLSREGVDVLCANRSYRRASNGVQYDWYIRVADGDDLHPPRETIEKILNANQAFQPRINPLRERAAELARELEQTQKERDSLHQHNLDLTEERDRLRNRCILLEKQLENHPDARQIDKDRAIEEWIADFYEPLEAKYKAIQAENTHLKEEKKHLCHTINEKNIEIATLQDGHDAYPESESSSEDPLILALRHLLSRVHLLRDSADVIRIQMGDRDVEKTLDLLGQLDRGQNIGAWPVQSADGWLEQHIKRNKWRLYYRVGQEGGKIDVLVSAKNQQDKDFNWLESQ
ncbi:MAG: hypothetical protein ACOX2R_01570 [Anaerolineae bacterium]